jgi:hypothetical protein
MKTRPEGDRVNRQQRVSVALPVNVAEAFGLGLVLDVYVHVI